MSNVDSALAQLRLRWEGCRTGSRSSGHGTRVGARWNQAENTDLLEAYLRGGMGLPALAKRHMRGVNGVAAQLNRLLNEDQQYRPESLDMNTKYSSTPATPPVDLTPVLLAVAGSITVQYANKRLGKPSWTDWDSTQPSGQPGLIDKSYLWRVKPTITVIRVHVDSDGNNLPFNMAEQNLELTYEDGVLVDSKVLV